MVFLEGDLCFVYRMLLLLWHGERNLSSLVPRKHLLFPSGVFSLLAWVPANGGVDLVEDFFCGELLDRTDLEDTSAMARCTRYEGCGRFEEIM